MNLILEIFFIITLSIFFIMVLACIVAGILVLRKYLKELEEEKNQGVIRK